MYIIEMGMKCRLLCRMGRKLLFAIVWTVYGSFIMRAITKVQFRDLRKRTTAVMTGMTFMYLHISRWKDMMHPSMLMSSIHGKDMRKFIRVRFRRDLIRLQAMWNILQCRNIWRERGCLFLSREQRADLHCGWTEPLLATVRILSPHLNLNWQIILKMDRISWQHRYSNGPPAAGVKIRTSSVSPEFTEMCIFIQFRIPMHMISRFGQSRKRIWM